MFSVVTLLLLGMTLVHSAPIPIGSDLDEPRDSKQLLTLAEFSKKVGQVVGEELTKVINGAYTLPPPTTQAPVTEEQTVIVYITEPPIPAETAAPEIQQTPASSVVQPEPAPVPAVTSAPAAVPVEAVTELIQEISTVEDEDEEETEPAEATTVSDVEQEASTNAASAVATNAPVEAANNNAATSNVEEIDENAETTVASSDVSTLRQIEEGDISTLPPPPIVEVPDTTEDDESDEGFTFPPVEKGTGQSVIEAAFENQRSTEAVPVVPIEASSTDSSSGTLVDEDDDDSDEDEDDADDNRTAKKVVKRIR